MKKNKKNLLVFLGMSFLFPRLALAQWMPETLSEFGLPETPVIDIIQGVMFWLLMALGVFSVIGFIVSGILYLTSAGSEDQMKRAKRAMNYSIIGVVVGLSGLVVVWAAFDLLLGNEF